MPPGTILRAVIGVIEHARHRVPLSRLPGVPEEIGRSHEGRPLHCYRFGRGTRKVLFYAGIHGNETGTVVCAKKIMEYCRHLPDTVTVLIVPCLNPDGYAAARKDPDYLGGGKVGRFNARGADLNRNFPTQSFQSRSVWSSGENYRTQTEVFAGDAPGSEPEIRALIDFVHREKVDLIVSLHNVARDTMGNDIAPSNALAERCAAVSGYRYFTFEDWLLLQQTGTAREWCKEQGIPYVEIELGRRWGPDWSRMRRMLPVLLLADPHS